MPGRRVTPGSRGSTATLPGSRRRRDAPTDRGAQRGRATGARGSRSSRPSRRRLPGVRRPAWMRLPGVRLPSWVPTGTPARRNLGMQVMLIVGLLVLSARLVQVQAVDADDLRARSAAQAQREVELRAQRGRIFDTNGAVLATTVQRAAIFVDPSVYAEFHEDDVIDAEQGEVARGEAATMLARVLDDVTRDEVLTRLTADPDSQFEYVAKGLDWAVGDEVLALDLPGVHRLDEPTRTYPSAEMAGPVLGFTNHEGAGVAGLELQYEELLRGEAGHLLYEVDGAAGMDIATSERIMTPPVPGEDLVLTIDRDIQATAQRVAQETMDAQRADGVSIVVLDARTAEVLAAASTPAYDPNEVREGDDWRGRPFTDVVEPGSVQKIVTVAAAWEEGLVDEDTVIHVPNTWTVGGKTWDSHGLGGRSMGVSEIVERSSNIGTMQIGDLLGPERLHDWLMTFGYGEPTGVGFPGETGGLVLPAEQWSATSLPTISIGHGVAISTIRLASVYQALANDGVMVQPTLVRGRLDDQGDLVPADRGDSREVVSADTAEAVRAMLRQVVEGEYGTGANAAIDGFAVGGKTGTAEKPREDGRGYSNQTTAVFAGIAPIDDPRLVVAVMVDEPAGRAGGVAAAPAFSQVMGQALLAHDVAPTGDLQAIDDAIEAARQAGAAAEREAAARAAARAAAVREAAEDAPRTDAEDPVAGRDEDDGDDGNGGGETDGQDE